MGVHWPEVREQVGTRPLAERQCLRRLAGCWAEGPPPPAAVPDWEFEGLSSWASVTDVFLFGSTEEEREGMRTFLISVEVSFINFHNR